MQISLKKILKHTVVGIGFRSKTWPNLNYYWCNKKIIILCNCLDVVIHLHYIWNIWLILEQLSTVHCVD